jgi:hypothetical protein
MAQYRGSRARWGSLVQCPLHFSPNEIEHQENERLWAQGVKLMNTFTYDAGGFDIGMAR